MSRSTNERQAGIVFVTLMVVLIPLLVLVGILTSSMRSNTNAVRDAIGYEKAFQAADCGVTDLTYLVNTTGLTSGTVVEKDLGLEMRYSAVPTDRSSDGIDNDNDGTIDESSEIGFDIVVVGSYLRYTRSIRFTLAPVVTQAKINSALTLINPNPQLQINFNGTGSITGNDTNVDGSAGPGPAAPGIAIHEPGTVADLILNLTVDDPSRITGAGPAPSYGVSKDSLSVSAIMDHVKANADIVLGASHANEDWRAGPNEYKLIYRNGDLKLNGAITGSGILVVKGNLHVSNNFDFRGVIIVTKDTQLDGVSGLIQVTGGLIQTVTSNQTQISDNVVLRYSSEAIVTAAVVTNTDALGVTEWELAGN